MKSLLLASIVIIFSASQVRISTCVEEDDKCFEEYQKQTIVESNCFKSHLDQDVLMSEVNETLMHYVSDDVAVRQFANKYCPKLESAISCFSLRYELSENCEGFFGLFKLNEIALFKEFLLSVLHYFCENNAETLVQAVQNGGLQTVFESDSFTRCARITSAHHLYKQEQEEFEINPDYCTAQDKFLECYVETVQSHKNANLIGIADTVRAKAREVFKC